MSNTEMKITVLVRAVRALAVSCQNAYNARHHIAEQVTEFEQVTNSDIVRAVKMLGKASEQNQSTMADIVLENELFYKGLENAPIKKFYRGIQGYLFAVSGDIRYLKGSVRTAIIAVCLALANADLTDRCSMFEYVNGIALTSGAIPFDMAKTIKRVLAITGTVKPNTSATQLSVAYGGDSPILLTWGILSKNGAILRNSKMLHLIMKQLTKLSDSAIADSLIWKK